MSNYFATNNSSQTPIASGGTYVGTWTDVLRYSEVRVSCKADVADGALWIRNFGGSPRLRRPFTITNTAPWQENIFGGLTLAEKTDIIPRITFCSTTNVEITFGYDVLVIADQ